MPDASHKPRKRQVSAGQRFVEKLGKAPIFPLKEVATALYLADKSKQAELLKALRSGVLVASVCWPEATETVDLPVRLWSGIHPEDFTVRERRSRGWHLADYTLPRSRLIRHLIVPRLRAIRDWSETSLGATTAVGRGQPDNGHAEALQGFDLAIRALERSRATAEVFVTRRNAHLFAIKYFGSITRRGPGAPKTEALWINEALIEAFARLYGANPRPKQDALCADLLIWWNDHFDPRSDTFIRDEILRPIWKALKLPKDA